MKSCCNHGKKDTKCIRKTDKKVFKLPRKTARKTCINKRQKGYSVKSSCAAYKGCKKSKFLFNPDDPKKSFDVYIDKNPKDTIPIKYKTVEDVRNTIKKLEKLYKQKKYTHKRIWQVGMIMKVRLEVILKRYGNGKNIKKRYKISKEYFNFLGERTKSKDRMKMVFRENKIV